MATTNQRPLEPLEQILEWNYQFATFVSWSHQMERRFIQFVNDLAAGLEDRFQNEGGAKVFWDHKDLQPGETWDSAMRRRLCRSAVMLAVLVPTYFQSEYCSIEWAIAMRVLTPRLPPGQPDKTCVIPIVLCEDQSNFPIEAAALQHNLRFRKAAAYSTRLRSYPKWPQLIDELAKAIKDIIVHLGTAPSAPPWEEEEAQALSEQRFPFTWRQPQAAPSAALKRLPTLIVEGGCS